MPKLVSATYACSICGWEGSEYAVEQCEWWHRSVLDYLGALHIGPEVDGPSPIEVVRRRYRREGVKLAVAMVYHFATRSNGESTPDQQAACRVVLEMLRADPVVASECKEDDDA